MFNILTNGMTVTLAANSNEFFAGNEGRIRVFNNGQTTLTNVEVTVVIPAGLSVTGNTPTAGVYAAGVWTLITLAVNAEEFLDLEFEVTDQTLRPYVITYSVTHDDAPDDDLSDNSASRTIDGIRCDQFTDCSVSLTGCLNGTNTLTTVTENYTATIDDTVILVDATLANTVLTLPNVADFYNSTSETHGCSKYLKIKVIANDGGVNTVTIQSANPAELIVNDTDIAGAADNLVLPTIGTSVTIYSNGLHWFVI